MNETSDIFKKINITDEYKSFVAISGNFSHAKPSIIPDENDESLNDLFSFSHPAYSIRTKEIIDAADYYTATEVGAKFKSREALYKYFNLDFTNTTEATCK